MAAVEGYVYLLYSPKTGLFKVGMSNDPDRRLPEVEADIRGMNWKLVRAVRTTDMRRLERAFHRVFASERAGKKEWFQLSPEQEELFLAVAETAVGAAPELGPEPSGKVDLPWPQIISELKRRREAMAAAVFGLAEVEDFDGRLLRLSFPEQQSFHVSMAREPRYQARLLNVIEEYTDRRPDLLISVMPVSSDDIIRDQQEVFRAARRLFGDDD